MTDDIKTADKAPETDPVVTSAPLDAPSDGGSAPEVVAEEPAPPLSRQDSAKKLIRDTLDAQPFRGNAVHKSDLLAVLDALIDGE